MFLEDELHAAYKFANAPILNFPFPHFYVENIFSDNFYSKIQENLLDSSEMMSMADLYSDNPGLSGYKERMVMDFDKKESMQKAGKSKREFWASFHKNFSPNFSNILRSKFKKFLDLRFTYLKNVSYTHTLQLVHDKKNYSLGPHTDQPSKVVSVLIYLPKDHKQILTGTSIYMPKDPSKLNTELPHLHYLRDDFYKVITMPYMPNSAFCFIKTNNSFHGVEKLEMEETDRWSLQYNIHITQETADRETEARNEHRKAANSSPQKTQSNFSI
jgi:hypothetical protein